MNRGVGTRQKAKHRLAVIYHPEKCDLRKVQGAVNRALTESTDAWLPTLWLPTTEQSPGADQAAEAIDSGATQLLVVGGDGTLRPVFGATVGRSSIYGEPIVIGLIPAGTGNILARNLGLPLNQLLAAARTAINGKVATFDGGRATMVGIDGSESSVFFTVLAGVGLDATIMLNTDAKLKSRIGWLAYWDAGFKSLPIDYKRVHVSVDGRPPISKRVVTLLVGNVGFIQLGMALMPQAKLNDGLLDVAVIAPRKFWHWMHFWSRVTVEAWVFGGTSQGRWLLDKTKDIKTLENLSGKVIEVSGEGPLNIQFDGDAFGSITRVRFEVLPDALHFRVAQ